MAHILHLTSVHQPFDGRIFHRECRTLAGAGYGVTLLAPAATAGGGSVVGETQREGVRVVTLPRPASRRGRPAAWIRLLRRAVRQRPDAVHFHDPELLLLVPLLRLALGRRTKIVYDVHEYFVDSLAVKHWIPPRLRPASARVAGSLEKLLVRRVDGLLFAVEAQAPLYDPFRGPVAVVRNLPSQTLFSRPEEARDEAGLTLIYVGLILPQRGIGLLLEALRRLDREGVRDVHLVLIGPETSPDYYANLRDLARDFGLADRVHWRGYVPPDQLGPYLAEADAGLVPMARTRQYSRPSLPTKLFEYLLAGLPVVCADQPHWRSYVEEGECGLVVPAEDAAALVEAILWLRDHRAEARAMGRRGRAMVLDRYTWEQEQPRLLDFYQSMLHAELRAR